MLTRDIDIANLSARRLSVRLSVRYVQVSDENGLTYRHGFLNSSFTSVKHLHEIPTESPTTGH